jgi:hypothetical protein
MAAKRKKNSLVENINRRKRRGTSRPKARSTVSKNAYRDMEEGWPKRDSKTGKKNSSRKQSAKQKSR